MSYGSESELESARLRLFFILGNSSSLSVISVLLDLFWNKFNWNLPTCVKLQRNKKCHSSNYTSYQLEIHALFYRV